MQYVSCRVYESGEHSRSDTRCRYVAVVTVLNLLVASFIDGFSNLYEKPKDAQTDPEGDETDSEEDENESKHQDIGSESNGEGDDLDHADAEGTEQKDSQALVQSDGNELEAASIDSKTIDNDNGSQQ